MYLTRMFINPARRGTRHLLASPQRMHAAVVTSFPPGSQLETGGGRVLWRVDVDPRKHTQLYVSSPARPDLTAVVEQAGWPASESTWQTATLDQLLDRLADGQQWRFRLTANPVHNVAVPGQRGKRLGHVTVDQQEQWLANRSAGWGFATTSIDVTSRRRLSFARRTDGTERTVTVSVATFDGILEVTDVEALRHSLGHGLGRAKAYGCGLLTLAPLS